MGRIKISRESFTACKQKFSLSGKKAAQSMLPGAIFERGNAAPHRIPFGQETYVCSNLTQIPNVNLSRNHLNSKPVLFVREIALIS